MPITLDDLDLNYQVIVDPNELENAVAAKVAQADSDGYYRGVEAALNLANAQPPPDLNTVIIGITALLNGAP